MIKLYQRLNTTLSWVYFFAVIKCPDQTKQNQWKGWKGLFGLQFQVTDHRLRKAKGGTEAAVHITSAAKGSRACCSAHLLQSSTVQGPAHETVLPHSGWVFPHVKAVKNIQHRHAHSQPGQGNPSSRLSSQVTLGCDRLIFIASLFPPPWRLTTPTTTLSLESYLFWALCEHAVRWYAVSCVRFLFFNVFSRVIHVVESVGDLYLFMRGWTFELFLI